MKELLYRTATMVTKIIVDISETYVKVQISLQQINELE